MDIGFNTIWKGQGLKGSIRQRSPGSYELTVDMGRDPLGRRKRKYTTVRGTKSQAQAKLRELMSTVDRGGTLAAEKITLRDWLARWMEEQVTPYKRQRTKERYQELIGQHIVPAIGHIQIGKLGPPHVQALEAKLSKRMAPRGVGLVHSVLSGALGYAMKMELIHRNPVSLVSPPPIKRREIIPPDIQTVRDALAAAKAEGHYLYPCIHLIAYTGLRRGEALGLNWKNVNLPFGHIVVEDSLVYSRERGLILEPPKTNSGRRVVDLDPTTVGVLSDHHDKQQGLKQFIGDAYRDEGRVFTNEFGDWVKPMMLTRAVKAMGRRVGYEGMTVRSLRHFHASVTLQSGQNIVVVSKRLGHANVSITADIYAHSLPGWQKQAAQAFADSMNADTNADIPDSVPQSPTAMDRQVG